MFEVVYPKNENSSAPEMASSTEPARMMKGSRETLESALLKDQIDEDCLTAGRCRGRLLRTETRRNRRRSRWLNPCGKKGSSPRFRQAQCLIEVNNWRRMTPWMRTASSCWNFLSSRGCVVVSSVANVESGTSLSSDPVTGDLRQLIGRQTLRPLDLGMTGAALSLNRFT